MFKVRILTVLALSMLALFAFSGAVDKVVAREPQPGDDRGGHGADDRSKLVG